MTTTLVAPGTEYTRFWLGSWTDLLESPDEQIRLQAFARYRTGTAQLARIISDRPVTVKWTNNTTPFAGQTESGDYQINLSGFEQCSDADASVGIALHEASHIVHSKHWYKIMESLKSDNFLLWLRGDLIQRFTRLGIVTEFEIIDHLKIAMNVLEDFRIDDIQYNRYSGYRGYYRALYQKYYEKPETLEILADDKRTIGNYLSHWIFHRHDNFNVDLLPGMQRILDVTDMGNLHRFTNDPKLNHLERNGYIPNAQMIPVMFETAQEVMCIILDNIETADDSDSKSQKLVFDYQNHSFSDSNDKLSDEMIELLNSSAQIDMEIVPWEDAELNMKVTGLVYYNYHLDANQKPFYDTRANHSTEVINTGVTLGKLLARRLKIMGEESQLRHNRKRSGNLDKRRLAALGYGDESVFEKIHDIKYDPVFVDLTVDASGSMVTNWSKTLQFMTTLAVAAVRAPKFDLRISLRDFNTTTRNQDGAVRIGVVFDSRINTLTHIRNIFPKLVPDGSTPEGVAFDIMRKIGEFIPAPNRRNFFVNLSDGYPGFASNTSILSGNQVMHYGGNPAVQHTKKIIGKLKEHYQILSYFVENSGGAASQDFRTMYGPAATTMCADDLGHIVKTLNHLFVERPI